MPYLFEHALTIFSDCRLLEYSRVLNLNEPNKVVLFQKQPNQSTLHLMKVRKKFDHLINGEKF